MARPGAKKRVKSEPIIMRRAPDGSAFLTCEACSAMVPVATADMHSCENDAAFKENLERLRIEYRERVAADAAAKKNRADKTKAEKSDMPEKGKGEKAAKKKAEKDPNAPKRPTTAYFLFLADFRKEYKENNPESKGITEMSKSAGARWQEMSPEDKEPYLTEAAELKKKYEAAMEEYKMNPKAEGVVGTANEEEGAGETENDEEGVGESENGDEERDEEESKPAKKKRLVSKASKKDETLDENLEDDIAE